MKEIKAEIISIGDELLIGQVVNTNASWIASELVKNGIEVGRITAIKDSKSEIFEALNSSIENIVLFTGGLGPTKDDITKGVLCNYFDSKLIFHTPTFDHIKSLFGKRNYPVTEVNKNQALIPDKCIPLFNQYGTAPGMWFETDAKVVVSMPGVPFEMKSLVTNELIPRLKQRFQAKNIIHRTIMTIGVGESMLAEKIADWENDLPNHIKLAYLPQPGIVRLRLSTQSNNYDSSFSEIESQISKLQNIIPDKIFGFDDSSLEEVVGNLLAEKGRTLSTAESCTGGYIAHLITSIAGSSNYFTGSVVSYANDVKVKQLNVEPSDIETYGAVSKEVVEQMAIGGRKLLNTDYCLATSGIAGPDGGTEDKPVGSVWIALASPMEVKSRLFQFGEHRGRNIHRSALAALNMLRKELS
ncbi:MAG TPA: competence/damage-inducible protein A [Bacteroidales bacterium]|jgi:nicotinamide-nucleotide amidase|nr:competence/damage-inducible protein A [Bacteroidota bacterium]HJN05074.1 competence/damage-inducible protein A [Bacteroidales bacterium]|tara:strand:+ start:3104 stop:4342 length:1239 start_codon:yes stop_codon:yes gene_type:complete